MKNIQNLILSGIIVLFCCHYSIAQTDLELLSQANAEQDNQKSIEIFDKAIKKFPNSAELYYERGNRKTSLIDFYKPVDNIGMIEDFDKAIQLAPEKHWYYVGRANAYNNLKKHQEAVKDCDKAIELALKAPQDDNYNSNLANGYQSRANAKQFLNDYQGAIADLEMQIKYASEFKANILADIGSLFEQLKDYTNALKYYTQSVEAYLAQEGDSGKSGAASVLWSRALLQINQMKKQAEGCADLKKSLELRPDYDLVKYDFEKYCK